MDPQTFTTLLINGGALALIVFLFLNDKLQTKKAADERVAEIEKQWAERLIESTRQWSERFNEMRADRNEWRKLALGTEKRLDIAVPTVATAIGVSLPSSKPTEGE